MSKYHLTEEGPRPCTASERACPVGGESEHYPNEQGARKAYETSMGEKYGATVSHTRVREAENVEFKARKALEERELLDRAEAALEADSSPASVKKVWESVESLDSVAPYKEDFDSTSGSAEDLLDITDFARSDVEMKLRESLAWALRRTLGSS